jgi:hypothetical protein
MRVGIGGEAVRVGEVLMAVERGETVGLLHSARVSVCSRCLVDGGREMR